MCDLSHVITDYGIKPDWIGDNATVTMYMAIYIVGWSHSYMRSELLLVYTVEV